MVTFLKRMESKGRVEGKKGDFLEKMDRYFMRARSKKSREEQGLSGGCKEGTECPGKAIRGNSSGVKIEELVSTTLRGETTQVGLSGLSYGTSRGG